MITSLQILLPLHLIIFYIFAVPSAPDNFTVVDIQDQQVTFLWEPPTTPNGNINGYMLNYSNTTDSLSLSLTADQLMITVDNLNEFTQYRFELRARTGAGYGTSAVIDQTTAEAGNIIITYLLVSE